MPVRTTKKTTKTTGLRYWMMRVLEECDRVATDFSADPVHDLRVALRRCRSMADGLLATDPDPDWKAMKKAGRTLFRSLGDLRDVQIMMEWIEALHPADVSVKQAGVEEESVARAPLRQAQGKLSPALPPADQDFGNIEIAAAIEDDNHNARDAAAQVLLRILAHRETQHKHEARSALADFDRKQWRHWSKSLPQRAARFRLGSPLFKHLALERWTEARALHNRAMRNRSQVSFHTLRIGIKRFRYIVENFLPGEHKAWSNDLKHIQDLLGEVHDLDVLWATATSSRVFPDDESRKQWHCRILEERTKRLASYHERMVGPDSLWQVWRAGLPQGQQIQALATRRMKLWAKALDPDFAHSERVAKLALELYDGLVAVGLLASSNGVARVKEKSDRDARASLHVAALLHDVGKSKGNKGHHKSSLELIKTHGAPLGWNPQDIQRAAIIARFHHGALPTRSHKALRDLLPPEQKITIQLAAILRLANALDAAHDGHIRRIQIENVHGQAQANRRKRTNGFLRKPVSVLARHEAVVIAAEGYTPNSLTAQTIAAERHLLETVLRRPVVVKPVKSPSLVGGSVRR
ncbi:MAG: CHAD domain-containing protein [Acidobacteriia bacterium]|nr:CHAD domain-containing protein [Terriglobia bacterium]